MGTPTAHRPALHWEGEEGTTRSLTYAELLREVNRAAGGLRALGVAPGDRVALFMPMCPELVIAFFAVIKIGGIVLPLFSGYGADAVTTRLRDAGVKVLITADGFWRRGQAVRMKEVADVAVAAAPSVEHVVVARRLGIDVSMRPLDLRWSDLLADRPDTCATERTGADDPLMIIYTSGTTGRPKGVKRTIPTPEQTAVQAAMLALSYGFTDLLDRPSEIVTAIVGPIYHAAPNAHANFSFRSGANIVVTPRFDPEELLRLIEKHRITHLNMVPIMFNRLLKLPNDVRTRYDLSSLRFVAHAAAPCAPDVKRAMIDWFGPVIYEFYGSTESSALTLATSEDALKRPGTVGRIMKGIELRFLDENDREVPQGEVGEIYSRYLGNPDFTYQNKPEKRAEIDRDGFVTSGDVGYIDKEGYVFLCDRKRDMVISGGVNIYPAEIEAALHAVPGVYDCAVFGIPDDEFGESLMAVVEPQAGAVLDLATIRTQLKASLADFKVPKRIEIQHDLPREDSGKIFKRRLRDPFWERAGRRI